MRSSAFDGRTLEFISGLGSDRAVECDVETAVAKLSRHRDQSRRLSSTGVSDHPQRLARRLRRDGDGLLVCKFNHHRTLPA
jgi:hypothetical protein